MDKLQVLNGMIVNSLKHPVFLRGVNIGGWMNMENFIDGYPGSEARLRALMKQELGERKASFFFDRFLDHFFNENDVAFLKKCGVTAIRLPLNYRHFELDQAPFEYLEKGFKRLDSVLDWCEKYDIYVFLDLHAVQGWQNCDWHCDNSSRHSLFWTHRQFQDRFYSLWKEIARRYHNRAVIAAFNIMNEPVSNAPFGRFVPDDEYKTDWENINRIYRKAIEEIHKIDTDRIIMLEGDYFSVLFSGLDSLPDANIIYSSHNYITEVIISKIPEYPLTLNGTHWDNNQIKKQFMQSEGYSFSQSHNVPLVVGEFGFNFQHAKEKKLHQIQAFADQLNSYNQCNAHWTFWTYKSVGSMGWLHVDPQSAYTQTIQRVITAKKVLQTDFSWLSEFPPEIQKHILALSNKIASFIPGLDLSVNQRYFIQAAMSTYTADQLQALYVRQFMDKSEKEIDEILSSLRLENCIQYNELNTTVETYLREKS